MILKERVGIEGIMPELNTAPEFEAFGKPIVTELRIPWIVVKPCDSSSYRNGYRRRIIMDKVGLLRCTRNYAYAYCAPIFAV